MDRKTITLRLEFSTTARMLNALHAQLPPALRRPGTQISARPGPLSDHFAEALKSELALLQGPVTLIAESLDWLEGQRVLSTSKTWMRKMREAKRVSLASIESLQATLTLELPTLLELLAQDDPAALVTAVAVRTVLDAAIQRAVICVTDVRVGRTRTSIEEVYKPLTKLLLRAERELHRRREAEANERKAARAARAAQKSAQPATHATAKPKKSAKKAPPPSSFGGLPDDAVPEDRNAVRPERGARGLLLDAEFFLDEAELPWPCDLQALERARKTLALRFHPDRAGPDAEPAFRRTMQGFHALIRWFESNPPPSPPPPHAPPPTTSPSPSRAAHKTKPPPATPRAKPPVEVPPAAPKRPTKTSSTGEWPPRPASARR
ncbi:MAG: hypothetical protein Q8Q09_15450 [Deltaproteobacteria bacterium]|nr:hypothetical protein [Deltaproteobacteria bacterium]